MNADIANTLRTHIHENVQWAQDYRSAVDSVLNSPKILTIPTHLLYTYNLPMLVALMMVLY